VSNQDQRRPPNPLREAARVLKVNYRTVVKAAHSGRLTKTETGWALVPGRVGRPRR
jgi:hypothetical protein